MQLVGSVFIRIDLFGALERALVQHRMEINMSPDQSLVESPGRGPTKDFAALNHVEPQSVLKRLCLFGSYHGVVPEKLANNRWDWPLVRAKRPTGTADSANREA